MNVIQPALPNLLQNELQRTCEGDESSRHGMLASVQVSWRCSWHFGGDSWRTRRLC